MIRQAVIAVASWLVLVSALPAPGHASPDVPMCVAEQPYVSMAPIDLIDWRIPMCGPFESVPPLRTDPPKVRAVEAFRRAAKEIASADYEEARLQLDLAYQGLPQIRDRIALQSGRLELLRRSPALAASFFAEAEQSPHETVRVKASVGRVFSLLRADDPGAGVALTELLARYPAAPERYQLLLEYARSLLRQQRPSEALDAMRLLRVDFPSTRASDWASAETARLASIGHETPPLTAEEEVRRARNLVSAGPLGDAKSAIRQLLEDPLAGELHAEVHYLAGRLARFEGRWRAAETYLRTAQLFPTSDPEGQRRIELRAADMASAAAARDPEAAKQKLDELRAGCRDFAIRSAVLVDMIAVASAAGLTADVDGMLKTLRARSGTSAALLFDAAMAGAGSGSDDVIASILESIARRPYSNYRTASLYHLARLHERSGRGTEAQLLFAEARAAAQLAGDAYYALWSLNGFERVYRGAQSGGPEGLVNPLALDVPSAPRAELNALADMLQPIADIHASSYPWIARAADLLRVGEPDAATEELFEAYLQWRQALGRPIARAGLACVATNDKRANPPIEESLRTARLGLSAEDRATLSMVAAALGDTGIAGAFSGPDLLDTLPRAYEWLVVPAAQRHGIDPNLLLAVMRVESAYQKHIVSYAGAVGLMQIMPRTGQLIAQALGRDHFTPAELLDPEVNLEFAAWYLASLIRRFDGRLPLAVAAYNGGPHNVRRWIQESADGTPLDVLLERIPFSQTHRYVRKVLVHYQAYREQRDLPMPQLSVVLPEQRVDPLAF